MSSSSSFTSPALKGATILSLALSLALPATLPTPATAQGKPAGNAAPTPVGKKPDNPIQALVKQRRYEVAVDKANELRAASEGGKGNADDEFWAARALRSLKRWDEARMRFMDLARNHPTHERAIQAEIEAPVMHLARLDGMVKSEDDRKLAMRASTELRALASKFEGKGDANNAARALYISGNALRMAQDDGGASADYTACMGLGATNDYPAKCLYARGVVAGRNFDHAKAALDFRACATNYGSSSSARKCEKALQRLDIIGQPAPELSAETWLNSAPVTLDEYKGNVVALFFFATWCPHCKKALPEFASHLENYKGRPLKLIAVTHNMKDQTTEKAKLFVADPQWNITYPAMVDARARTSLGLGATGVPTAVLIDKAGIVRWVDHPNSLTTGMLDKLLAE
jgi:thiol-disulfide isomerase/thioredoxin